MKTLVSIILISVSSVIISCNGHRVNKNQVLEQIPDKQLSQHLDQQKDYSKLGTDLLEKESIGGIKLGININVVESLIGSPSEKTEPTEWGADGLNHQTFKYSSQGIELDLIQKPDSSFSVDMITVTSPCKYKTTGGIGIDSGIEDVKKAYLSYIDPNTSNENEIIAGTVYGGILFKLAGKKVTSIFFGAAAE